MVFETNRVKPRAKITPVNPDFSLSLDGEWDFNWVETLVEAPKIGEDIQWKTVTVPHCWEMEGYGNPVYVGEGYPFVPDPPHVPVKGNHVGTYRKSFETPKEWDGKEVYLVFDGVCSAFYVYVNGKEVGYGQGSRTEVEFRVTECLQEGVNELMVQVLRWSDGTYLEDQDMWQMSGIHRGVYIYATPSTSIRDYYARTEFDEGFEDAKLLVTVNLESLHEKETSGYGVSLRLLDNGVLVAEEKEEAEEWWMRESIINFDIKVEKPKHWNHETPHLYDLELTLLEHGKEAHSVTHKIGFRQVDIEDGQILINGKPVLLNGVNRHEHHPVTGKTVSRESMIEDIHLIKRFNFNAVRNSHYPNDAEWYRLCDEYGLYIVDEANIETDGIAKIRAILPRQEPANDPDWLPAMTDRVVRMVERSKNHACVIMWSLGNEAGNGPNFEACAGWAHYRDPTRPVHYEGVIDHWNKMSEYVDVLSVMYPAIDDDTRFRRGKHHWPPLPQMATHEGEDRPLIACEYAHAMGNGPGNFKEYWDLFREEKRLCGGFVWDWVDQGIQRHTPAGEAYYAYGGEWGDPRTAGSFCLNGVVYPDRRVKPSLYEMKKVGQPVLVEMDSPGLIKVTNLRYFTDLSDLSVSYEISLDGVQVIEGDLPRVKVGPGEYVLVDVPVGNLEQGIGEYWLTIYFESGETRWCEAGSLKAWEQFRLNPEDSIERKGKIKKARVTVNEETGVLSLGVGSAEINLDPSPNLWRAPTDNDIRNMVPEWKKHKIDQLRTHVSNVLSEPVEDGRSVIVQGYLKAEGVESKTEFTTGYTIKEDGSINVTSSVSPPEEYIWLPRVGVQLRLPESMDKVTWFGKGPHENYVDRNKGSMVGLYELTVDDLFEPYIVPQENGSRSETRWVEFTDGKHGFRVKGDDHFEFSAHRYDIEDLEKAEHLYQLERKPYINVYLDMKQAGLGSASCGPDTLFKYRVESMPQTWSFIIEPV